MPVNADLVRLRHMLDAAKEALSFAQGRTRNELDQNRMLVLSLVKSIKIIGEAASRVSADVRESYPEMPWLNTVAMRSRLVHAYFDIDLDRLWDTVTDDLPPLVTALEKILHAEEADSQEQPSP